MGSIKSLFISSVAAIAAIGESIKIRMLVAAAIVLSVFVILFDMREPDKRYY